MLQTDLPLVELEVLSGSAMIEAGDLGENVVIRVKTPHTSVRIKKDGLYRIDAHSAQTRVSVRKGELEYLTRGDMKKLKKDKQAVLKESSVEIVKLDEDQLLDDFDLWVKDRAEIMIAANQSLLRRRSFGTSLFASSWVFDPFFGCYTFVPYGYMYRSPWGGRFIYYAPYYSFYGYGYWPGYYPNGGYSGGGGGRIPTPNQPPALTANESKVGLRVGGARADRGDSTRPDRISNEGGGRIFPTPRNETGFSRGAPDVFSSPSTRGSMGNTGTVSVPASAPASAPAAAPRTEGGVRETGSRGRERP
jgi:hypothetical protein